MGFSLGFNPGNLIGGGKKPLSRFQLPSFARVKGTGQQTTAAADISVEPTNQEAMVDYMPKISEVRVQ